MMKKTEILDLCKLITNDFSEWQFQAQMFKNKTQKSGVKLIAPLWTFSPGTALAQPVAGFSHPKIDAIYKKLFNYPLFWVSRIGLDNVFEEYKKGEYLRFYNIEEDHAQEKIKKMLKDGIEIVDKYYDFSSEQNLLENMPKDIEGHDGIVYCIVRAYLNDFEFVRFYREDKIETKKPKLYKQIDQIIEFFGI